MLQNENIIVFYSEIEDSFNPVNHVLECVMCDVHNIPTYNMYFYFYIAWNKIALKKKEVLKCYPLPWGYALMSKNVTLFLVGRYYTYLRRFEGTIIMIDFDTYLVKNDNYNLTTEPSHLLGDK